MLYEYKFWHQLAQPSSLSYSLENSEDGKLKGYKKAFWGIFGFTLLFFIVRNIWGVNTDELTYLLANQEIDRYSFARLVSLGSAVLFGVLFFVIHYYIITYFISLLTELPYRWIQKVQLYVIGILVLEKVVELIIFAVAGFATPFTMFSLAPMTAYLYYHDYLLYFLNSLTVGTVMAIWVQYTFLSQWVEESKKSLLFKLILIHVVIAIIVAIFNILPISEWLKGGM